MTEPKADGGPMIRVDAPGATPVVTACAAERFRCGGPRSSPLLPNDPVPATGFGGPYGI